MRLSELIGAPVTDADGRPLGPVRDVRLEPTGDAFRVVGLVVGGGRLAGPAHAWGYAEGRAQGPWLFRALTRDAVRKARLIRVEDVAEWSPERVRITRRADHLEPLRP